MDMTPNRITVAALMGGLALSLAWATGAGLSLLFHP
jgi:hypothetical protein